ncbi:MAG: rhamnulokinase [Planctomycetota bacterium]
MKMPHFLAFDLGAESGRAVLGTLTGRRLTIKELNRFPNGMLNINGRWHWNIFRLYEEIKHSLKIAAGLPKIKSNGFASLGLDTWGVDFALLDRQGNFLGLPFAYRDNRTNGMMEKFFKLVPRQHVYQLTGIQFLQFNTLFQLFALVKQKSPLLKSARDLLFIPDIFNYLLTGQKKTEFSFATTSQLYNPQKKDWDEELFKNLGISRSIMQKIILPGSVIGNLTGEIFRETGFPEVPVIAPASHDTGSAVAAVPSEGEEWAYLSSGTWSLMGVETKKPVLTKQALDFNFTNEGGVGGTFRFLKNITGLWILQQCRQSWTKRKLNYQELAGQAASAPPFKALINPDQPEFLNPPDMPEAMAQFCRQTKQPVPKSPAEITRCILESLALKYRTVLDQLRKIYPKPIKVIHIIGGGVKNSLLCQFTADATGLPVLAGPAEATAIGNIMVQAMGLGYVNSLSEARAIIKHSFTSTRYEPRQTEEWNKAYAKFCEIKQP